MGELVTIARFTVGVEAHLAKGRLEAEGIPAFIADEHMASLDFVYSSIIGGVRLRVRKVDAERAIELLNSELAEEGATGDGEYASPGYGTEAEEHADRCPVCNSTEVGPDGMLAALNPFSSAYECRRCLHKWKR